MTFMAFIALTDGSTISGAFTCGRRQQIAGMVAATMEAVGKTPDELANIQLDRIDQ